MVSETNSVIPIAFCTDKLMEVGLHATLFSLMENTSRKVKIYLFYEGFSNSDLELIHVTLKPFEDQYELLTMEIDIAQYKGLLGLYGNLIVYYRLTVPQLIKEDKFIYLDSDLLIMTDIAELFDFPLGTKLLGARSGSTINSSNDSSIFKKLDLSLESMYFNAGVLLINTKEWKKEQYSDKGLELARKHNGELLYYDQTILNILFHNNYEPVPEKFNFSATPASEYDEKSLQDKIIHFIYSPKPWDFLGEYKHNQYQLFKSVMDKTAFKGHNSWNTLSFQKLYRAFRIGRMYFKNV